jgi:hypothetical protein
METFLICFCLFQAPCSEKLVPAKAGMAPVLSDLALASFGCILHGFGDAGFRRDHHARD